MTKESSQIKVKAWESSGFLLEAYHYSTGQVEPLPNHVHSEYQFAFSPGNRGEYFYRGANLLIPAGALCVLHSGEPHTPSAERFVFAPAFYQMLYVAPEEMRTAASEIAGKQLSDLPYFPRILISDAKLVAEFLNLFSVMNAPNSRLERDEARLRFLIRLISRHAQNQFGASAFKSNAVAVRRAQEFLHANFLLDFSLSEVALAAGVGKFYLCRAFRRQIGVSPHAFQTYLRISYAKKLLLQNFPAAEVAALTGFYDQSHFGRYFKRLVGVSPKSYSS